MSDTFQTACFKHDKAKGGVKKTGLKARFSNGRQALERILWHDFLTGEWYVVLGGQALVFYPYADASLQDKANPDIIYGCI